MVEQEGRREMVEFSEDQDRWEPLAAGDVTIVRISEATVRASKQSTFCVREGEACKEGRVKSPPPPMQICTNKQDEPTYIGSASAHYYRIVNCFNHVKQKSSLLVFVFYRCLQ